MILSGTRPAQIVAVQLIDIHGTRLYDLRFQLAGETQFQQARLGLEAVYPEPRPGDLVVVRYLMGVVTAVERAA